MKDGVGVLGDRPSPPSLRAEASRCQMPRRRGFGYAIIAVSRTGCHRASAAPRASLIAGQSGSARNRCGGRPGPFRGARKGDDPNRFPRQNRQVIAGARTAPDSPRCS